MGEPEIVPSGFFCLRTHLLPFEQLIEWSSGLTAVSAGPADRETAFQADLALLRGRLQAIIARPEVREAIFVASPALDEAIDIWKQAPESDRGRRAERSLVKYLARLTTRPTPFGLFAGVATGITGRETRLEVPGLSDCRRHTRLDNEYLFALAHALNRDPEVRRQSRYRANDSLVFAAGHGRYAEARPASEGHTFHLVGVEETEALRETLARAEAAGGAPRAELAGALVDRENTLADAEAYIDDLIESQILVGDLGVKVTGPEPAETLARRLAGISSGGVAEGLRAAIAELERLDAAPLGNPPAQYRSLAAELGRLPVKAELPRLFQVDLVRTDGGTLGEAVVQEIRRGVTLLQRIAPPPEETPIDRFTRALVDRYEGRMVPLLEALDEEVGVGASLWPAADPSPLLKELPLAPAEAERVAWGPRTLHLLHQAGRAATLGQLQWSLGAADIEALSSPPPHPPLPVDLAAMVTVAATSSTAVGRGEFELHLQHVDGPNAGRLLGRFCHADPRLQQHLLEHIRLEEERDPDALHAELVHLPEGRLGNILLRPLLRRGEITYLGHSGAPPESQIPASDLLIGQRQGRLELWSRRLQRRIVPRLTSAHNFSTGLAPYRFLSMLQDQGQRTSLQWSWGEATGLPFLPRVTHGRLVLSLARWRLSKAEIREHSTGSGHRRFDSIQRLRAERRLPRWVVLVEWDNRLPIDLDNPMAVDGLIHEMGDHDWVTLEELWPADDCLLARGPEGSFRHELVVPFHVRQSEGSPSGTAPLAPRLSSDAGPRRFPPGSEWLYVKLYTSQAEADEILEQIVGPVSRRWVDKEVVDRWFFLRYADPEYHLRWRLHGDSGGLTRKGWPAIQKAVAPLVAAGKVWRVQLDTYVPEVERYGGPAAIGLAEQLFQIDSETVVDLLGMLEAGDGGLDERWRLALAGADRLLEDFGLTLDQRLEQLQGSARYGSIPEPGPDLRHRLTDRFRAERARLEAILQRDGDKEPALAPGLEVLGERSARSAPVVGALIELSRQGRLEVPLGDLAGSCIHMHLNRLLRGAPNAHETVIYDFLRRVYQSRLARQGSRARSAESSG